MNINYYYKFNIYIVGKMCFKVWNCYRSVVDVIFVSVIVGDCFIEFNFVDVVDFIDNVYECYFFCIFLVFYF